MLIAGLRAIKLLETSKMHGNGSFAMDLQVRMLESKDWFAAAVLE